MRAVLCVKLEELPPSYSSKNPIHSFANFIGQDNIYHDVVGRNPDDLSLFCIYCIKQFHLHCKDCLRGESSKSGPSSDSHMFME